MKFDFDNVLDTVSKGVSIGAEVVNKGVAAGVETISRGINENFKKCPKCGQVAGRDVAFCAKCGTSLLSSDEAIKIPLVEERHESGISYSAESRNSDNKEPTETLDKANERIRDLSDNEKTNIDTIEMVSAIREKSVTKCPNCGASVDAFQTICPYCRSKFTSSGEGSVKVLSKRLQEIENNRKKTDNLFSNIGGLISGKQVTNTDEQKANLISSFAIPNDKEDILEFLMMAAANIDMDIISKDNASGTEMSIKEFASRKALANAWRAKYEQAFSKASMMLKDDPDFKKIEDKCLQKNDQLEKADQQRQRSRYLPFLIILGLLLFCILLPLIM